jgi:hypothetical protein
MNIIEVYKKQLNQTEEFPLNTFYRNDDPDKKLSGNNLLQRSLSRLKYSYSKNLTTIYDYSNYSLNVENNVANNYISSKVILTREDFYSARSNIDSFQRAVIIYKYQDKFLIPMQILENSSKTLTLRNVRSVNLAQI